MTFYRRVLLSGAALCLMGGWADISTAQPVASPVAAQATAPSLGNFNRDRSVSVRQRSHEGYEALGVPLGVFMAWPKVAASVERNDNIYASPTNEAEDTIWRVQPDLRIVSTWSRHYLEAFARGTIARYSDFETENSEDYSFGANGRIDIQRGFNLSGGASTSHITEPRTSSNTATASVDPIQYDLANANLGVTHEFNRLKLTGKFDVSKFDYEDGRAGNGSVIEQDDRDRTNTTYTGRGDYAVSPDTALFVEVTGNKRDYRLGRPAVTAVRDSDGYSVLAGANFEISALMRGEIGVGYLSQSYEDPAFNDIDGFGARALVEWFPTELTTLTLNGSRTIEDSGIPGNAGYLATNLNAQIDHELLRNVILSAQAGYGKDEHKGLLLREDKRINFGVSGTYLLNRNVGVNVGYNYLDQDSNLTGFDFKQNRLFAGLTFQF